MIKTFFKLLLLVISSNLPVKFVFSQVVFESSNLPIIKINTDGRQIIDEPKVLATMQIIDNGPGQRNSVNDTVYNYNGYIGIELRGSSSRNFPKNNFGIETWTQSAADTAVSLLGLPEENDWVLHGPYSDKSLMRNVLTYKISNAMGRYASRTVFCELVLNDTYWGLYVLMEKVKRDKNRVDIADLRPDENAGDSLTGGYIIKLDKFDGNNSGPGWESPFEPFNYASRDQSIYFQYEYPKNNDITETQKSYIRNYVTAFENALAGSSYNDPIFGYRKYADVESMIDFLITNEVAKNVDGYRLSTFIQKDKDSKNGKLVFGPIWDLNLGYGNANYCDGQYAWGWAYRFNYVCNQDYWLIPFWWYKLMGDYQFRTQLLQRWAELRNDVLKTENVWNYIDSTAAVLGEASQRNFTAWPVLGVYIWPNNYIGQTYSDEISFLKTWIQQRLDWLDANFEIMPSSLDDKTSVQNLSIYPNPFIDFTNIVVPVQPGRLIMVKIMDTTGNEIWSKQVSAIEPTITWNSLDNYGNPIGKGIYVVLVQSGNKVISHGKMIKLD